MNLKTAELRPKYKRFRVLNKNSSGVSEAVGTILLLAVAIVLIASVAAWVQTIPQPAEHLNVKFDVTYSYTESQELTVEIEHMGGDELDVYQTYIRLTILFPAYISYDYQLSESNNLSMSDGIWSIGENWNYTMTGIPKNAEINA